MKKVKLRNKIILCSSLISVAILSLLINVNCGGRSGDNTPISKEGIFLDSAAEGIEYETGTQSGITDSSGMFKYREGETITFSIGGVILGSTLARETLTPIDLVAEAVDETNPIVTNMCRLLQSLDKDGNPDNGITISSEIRDEMEEKDIDFTLSIADFENHPDVQSLLQTLNALGIFTDFGNHELCTVEQARSHLRRTVNCQGFSSDGSGSLPLETHVIIDESLSCNPRLINQRVSADSEQAEIDTMVAGNNTFAWELYHELKKHTENLLFCPYTVSKVMSMTYAGAREETARQIQQAMHFDLEDKLLHAAFNALDLSLKPKESAAEVDAGLTVLDTDSGAWGQVGYAVKIDFFNLLAAYYGSPLQGLEFNGTPWDADSAIQEWISSHSKSFIPNATSSVTRMVRLTFAAATAVNSAWKEPFDPDLTFEGSFNTLDGQVVTAPMMTQTGFFPFTQEEGYKAIELSLENSSLAIMLLLPDSGFYHEFEDAMDRAELERIAGRLEPRELFLKLPRFNFAATECLNDALYEMGITEAMAEGFADFSGINKNNKLYINGSNYNATISVAERGVQAGASTTTTIASSEEMPEPGNGFITVVTILPGFPVIGPPITTVAFSRPFIFILRDTRSGVILFMGRVLNPAEEPS